MVNLDELKADADQRWQALVNGPKPWIRVGTAMCGHAAGAFDTLLAVNEELERLGPGRGGG